MLELPPISLYIHYPWCVKKCPYCDFNSHEGKINKSYVDTLLIDLEQDLHYLQGRAISSIFIGGGTPSLMSYKEISKIIKRIYETIDLKKNIEITLESNPGTFEIEKFAKFKEAGINRLSIGVQSFNDKNLQNLGRIHSGDDAIYAIEQAKTVGFDNFNIDLMYALEGQTSKQCLADLKQAIAFNPAHISFYQLTLEKNTLFAKFPPQLPNDEAIWNMSKKAHIMLENNGYKQYEISAFAKKISKHNINYWQFGDYLGIGAGAHGKITNIKNKIIFRTLKPKSPKDYLLKFKKNNLGHNIKTIDNTTFEFMLNALRLKAGFDLRLFESRTGNLRNTIKKKLQNANDLGLLNIKKNMVIPTTKGFNFVNNAQEMFL